MQNLLDFFLLFLTQFAGGPGPVENNLVRFGLPAVLWAILFYIAWSRQRSQDLPREKLLVWGFGLAFVRELYMFGQMAFRLLSKDAEVRCEVIQPLEHGLATAAMIVVAAAFMRYILNDDRISRLFLQTGIGITLLAFVLTSWTWPRQLEASPLIKFHQTWAAWLFHIPLALLMGFAVVLIYRKRGWLQNTVGSALTLYLLSELLLLVNYATDRVYNYLICPVGNSLHILAIPLFGFVYLQEQAVEKKRAEEELIAYRDHLEELVENRTAELTAVNTRLTYEITERTQAEKALERLTRRYELILETAGEGICGIDPGGRIVFANPTAARMSGYAVEELVDRQYYEIWHPAGGEDPPHPLEECPIYVSYSQGLQRYGEDEVFRRKDGEAFPVRYFSNPVQGESDLTGAVVVFQDITAQKRIEAEVAQRSASLETQNAVAAALSQSLEIEENLKIVLEMVRREARTEIGLVYFLEPDGKISLQVQRADQETADYVPYTREDCFSHQLARQVLEQKQAVIAQLTEKQAQVCVACANQAGICSLVGVPLISKGRSIGVIILGSRQAVAFQPHTLNLLTAVGQQIGMAVENARLYKGVENWAGDLVRLQEASSYLARSLDPQQVMAEIARQSAWLMNCQKACVLRLDNQATGFSLAAAHGLTRAEQHLLQRHLPGLSELARNEAGTQSLAVPDASVEKRLPVELRRGLHLKALLLIPIWRMEAPGEFILVWDHRTARSWSAGELELIENLANRSAVALVNASLHHQLELSAALQERQRIAAKLHDGLAQTLSLLGMRVDKMQDLVGQDANPEAEDVLDEIQTVVAAAAVEVRRSIASLQEAPRPRSSLQQSLRELVDELREVQAPMLTMAGLDERACFLPPDQTEQLLMIVREAVLNAARHAQAQSIQVRLEIKGDRFQLLVVDDGCGFEQGAAAGEENHFGLSIMRARAARMGGTLHIDSTPGGGTRVQVNWRSAQEDNDVEAAGAASKARSG